MREDLQRALAGQPVSAESVMTDAERTQFIATARPTPRPGPLTPVYDDDEDDHHRGALVWTAVILALLLVIGGAAAYLLHRGSKPSGPAMFAVPSLVGLSPSAADDQIRAAHLIRFSGTPAGSNGPCSAGGNATPIKSPVKGQVCTQDPAAGLEEAENSTVTYTVYAGPPNVLVQQVVGLSYADAQKALASQGLIATRVDVDSSQPAGQVISQDPPANASVAPGTPVQLKVANGKVKLPDVTKLTEAQARAKLNQLGFTNIAPSQTAPVQDGFKVGQVMAIDPTPGIFYNPNTTTITLTIAALPPCPSTTPSSSSSPSASGTPTPSPTPSPTCSPTG
jgi:serine/threonine-protein kinase